MLDIQAAKSLLEVSGASSLSMHPHYQSLIDTPVLMLGLEGPSHSFIRFKSFSIKSFDSVQPCWKLNNDEWGVLASSSQRLAKSLYLALFEDILDNKSKFAIEKTSQL